MSLEQDLEYTKLRDILIANYPNVASYAESIDALIEEKTTGDDIFFKKIYDFLRDGFPSSNEARLAIFRKYAEKLRKYEKEEK